MPPLRSLPLNKYLLTPHTPERTFHFSSHLRNTTNTQQPSPLAGKRCIITGASRGIGAEIARRFAREGARCLLIGRNKDLLEKVRAELRKVEGAEGEEHGVLVGDVGDGGFWGELRREVSFSLSFSISTFGGKSGGNSRGLGRVEDREWVEAGRRLMNGSRKVLISLSTRLELRITLLFSSRVWVCWKRW